MQGNYEPHTGFQGVSQNRDDYTLVRVISDRSGTFLYKNIEHKYEVIGMYVDSGADRKFIATRVEE